VHTLKNNKKLCRSWTVKKGKAWVCGRSLAGIVGPNPAGGIDISLLSVVCYLSGTERSLRRADHSSREVLLIMVCLSVIVKLRQ
jgi:hypothetical protein